MLLQLLNIEFENGGVHRGRSPVGSGVHGELQYYARTCTDCPFAAGPQHVSILPRFDKPLEPGLPVRDNQAMDRGGKG